MPKKIKLKLEEFTVKSFKTNDGKTNDMDIVVGGARSKPRSTCCETIRVTGMCCDMEEPETFDL